jgi:UDP-glucuronate 4-epimerase
LQAPFAYARSNLLGHLSVLEMARHLPRLGHLVYASSSSVYGGNTGLPWRESDRVDTPLSLYAATKRADELMSHAYAHLFHLPQTGLRFFTVYGPWGRPDMAYFNFAEAILDGRPITVYDGGCLQRDFTYIDDIVAGVLGALDSPPEPAAPRLLNIGNHRAETVATLIALLERALDRRAVVVSAPRPKADPEVTYAAIDDLAALTGFAPCTPLAEGIPRFCHWLLAWRDTRGQAGPVAVATG